MFTLFVKGILKILDLILSAIPWEGAGDLSPLVQAFSTFIIYIKSGIGVVKWLYGVYWVPCYALADFCLSIHVIMGTWRFLKKYVPFA